MADSPAGDGPRRVAGPRARPARPAGMCGVSPQRGMRKGQRGRGFPPVNGALRHGPGPATDVSRPAGLFPTYFLYASRSYRVRIMDINEALIRITMKSLCDYLIRFLHASHYIVGMRYRTTLGVAVASLLALEGVSFARTPATPVVAPASASTVDATIQLPVGANAPSTRATQNEFSSESPALQSANTRIRVCHISRHPRDGMRSEEHACPLFIAEAEAAAASSAGAPAIRD